MRHHGETIEEMIRRFQLAMGAGDERAASACFSQIESKIGPLSRLHVNRQHIAFSELGVGELLQEVRLKLYDAVQHFDPGPDNARCFAPFWKRCLDRTFISLLQGKPPTALGAVGVYPHARRARAGIVLQSLESDCEVSGEPLRPLADTLEDAASTEELESLEYTIALRQAAYALSDKALRLLDVILHYPASQIVCASGKRSLNRNAVGILCGMSGTVVGELCEGLRNDPGIREVFQEKL